MAEKYKLISEISPGQRNWSAKVIVTEKFNPKIARNSPTKYQNMKLIDPKGNSVNATIYAQDIQAFEDKFQIGRTYLVSNAQVRFTKQEYRATAGDIQWTINGRTRVEEVKEAHNELLFSTFKFVSFDKLQDYMDDRTREISIFAIVIDMRQKRKIQNYPEGESTVQEICLINQRFETTMLTLWDNFVDKECNTISKLLAKRPIIIGTHLRVTSFNGLSISSKPNSSFLIDPHFEEVIDLKSWVDANVEKLNDIISKRSYLISTPKLSAPRLDQLTALNKIQDMLFMKTFFWVKAKVNVKILNQPFWYMSCDKCNKISNADYNKVYECIYCKSVQARATPRARANIQLQDSSGSIQASIVGEPAETLLQCTAKTLMEKMTTDQPLNIDEVICKSTENEIFIYLKVVKKPDRNGDYKYNVISIVDSTMLIEESSSANNLDFDIHQTKTQSPDQVDTKAKRVLFSNSRNEEDLMKKNN